MANILKSFAIEPHDGGYRLRIETENGVHFEFFASFNQLDFMAESIDRQLDDDQDPSN